MVEPSKVYYSEFDGPMGADVYGIYSLIDDLQTSLRVWRSPEEVPQDERLTEDQFRATLKLIAAKLNKIADGGEVNW